MMVSIYPFPVSVSLQPKEKEDCLELKKGLRLYSPQLTKNYAIIRD